MLEVFIIYLCHETCLISSAVFIRFWFGWLEQIPSFKLKHRCVVEAAPNPVWCYLAFSLIGCLFFILLTASHSKFIYCSVPIVSFWFAFANQRTCSMSIWASSQPNLKFAWSNTLQQSIDTTVTIFCWKVALAEMFIVVLGNQKQPWEVLCKKIVNFANSTGKPVPSSLQLY